MKINTESIKGIKRSGMKKLYALCLSFFALTIVSLALFPSQTVADGGCTQLNNGGITNQQFCPTPTILPTPAPFTENIPQQGGQPVYPSPKTKSTPNTGPTTWSLFVLIAAGGTGLLLKKTTKIT